MAKKSLIVTSGYLNVDPSGMKAVIMYSNGEFSPLLFTKAKALEYAELQIGEGLVVTEEYEFIRRQIHDSNLPNLHNPLESAYANQNEDAEKALKQIEGVHIIVRIKGPPTSLN